eukprot:gnl/Spiro4/23205_TR11465_c0_g1_i1.p2 gnl/Spiro4/23205_TR11465_c0_g1~~gnl/Spiro4/23205_TR11465_c0_g1_i1.p2  ORF type:complete len:340 (+),score=20.12 gnl/Spiro4/23205_TR11465_c0_g1_i1:2462-3481(+)
MSSWVEHKYVMLLSNRLEGFKAKSDRLFNFRCALCYDSHKNKHKKRGYIYVADGRYRYHCHNCGASMPFLRFLKDFDVRLYQEYNREVMVAKGRRGPEKTIAPEDAPIVVKNNELRALSTIAALPEDHTARRYLDSRQLPKKFYPKLYYADNFREFTNSLFPGKFEHPEVPDPRIVIPLIDEKNFLVGYQGRSLSTKCENDLRYITIMLDKTKPRLFGADRVDYSKTFYVTEGPFDACFLHNSLAVCGASIALELLKNGKQNQNAVVVYDNERRNAETVAKNQEAIDHGFKVVIWPPEIRAKDINAMIVEEKVDPITIISQNTFEGLKARAKLLSWKRV